MSSIQDLEQRKFGSQDANGNVAIKVLTVSNTDQITRVTQESILPDYVYDKCIRTQNGAGTIFYYTYSYRGVDKYLITVTNVTGSWTSAYTAA